MKLGILDGWGVLQLAMMTKRDPEDKAMLYQQYIATTMTTMHNMMTDRGRERRQR
jgi:hypothetical protein